MNPQSEIRNPQSIVFVVDDDPSVRKGLSRLLRSAGYDVETFSSAQEFLSDCGSRNADCGLEKPSRALMPNPQSPGIRNPKSEIRNPQPPCCLVLDLSMPGLNGLELQQALDGSEHGMPIVFVSGHGDIPMSVRAMKKGAVDFLIKPIDDRDLLAAIAVALAKDKGARGKRARVEAIRKRVATLTPREREVMKLVVLGRLNKQIAAALGIAEKTVKVHRGRVMTKMGVASVAELVTVCASADA